MRDIYVRIGQLDADDTPAISRMGIIVNGTHNTQGNVPDTDSYP